MVYILANGKEVTVGREDQSGLLRFILPEDGGTLPDKLSGKFTAQKYLDEAWGQYESTTEDLRTREPLAETRADGGAGDSIKPLEAPVAKPEVKDTLPKTGRPVMIEEEKKPEGAFTPEVEKVLTSEAKRNKDAIDEAPLTEAA